MALTRVSGRVVYPHGEDTPTPVTGDGVIEYVHATPGVIGEAVHGPDRHRIEYTGGVAGEAWLKAGMWRAYVYPSEGRSYTLHLGIPEDGDVTLADVVGEVVPDGIVTRGEQGEPGASVVGGRDNGDGTVSFELSDGTFTEPVVLPPGPAGRGVVSVSDPDAESRVTITYTDGSTSTVQAIRGAQGEPGEKGEPGDDGADSTVPGPPGPPGQVLTPESMLVVGPGRPDAPTTTGMTSGALAALPVGCEYRSTDGASVGAWVWRKQPTGWVVTDGDTGSRIVDLVDGAVITYGPGGSEIVLAREGATVYLSASNISGSGNVNAWQKNIPAGFRPSLQYNGPLIKGEASGLLRVLVMTDGRFRISGSNAATQMNGLFIWKTADPWPTTLPGA